MTPQHRRAMGYALAALVVIWGLAWVGHAVARRSRMTAEKFHRYVQTVDLQRLQGDERARTLREMADKLNRLPPEERRQVRLERQWEGWFTNMTEPEKEAFIEATLPSGIKQMVNAFEKLPPEQRKRTIDRALERLRNAREQVLQRDGAALDERWRNSPPVSPELEAKVRTTGLKAFIANSSAQTKAEVAPLLEEMQRIIESGGHVRRHP